MPAAAIAVVYIGLTMLTPAPDAAQAPADPLSVVTLAEIAPAGGNPLPVAADGNMKAAFDLVPQAPQHDYIHRREEDETTPVKVVAVPAVEQTVSASSTDRLAYIQSGISSILQAGSQFLVSEKRVSVGKGDTLMDLLVRNNVPRTEAYDAIQALSKVYDPRGLNPSHAITVFFHRDPAIADPKFSGLQIEKDKINTVIVNRADDGRYMVDQEEKQVHRTLRGFRGTINSSLYVSAKSAGVPDGVILDMIKMYSWNVDFQRDIQSGDGFEVMYEEFVTDAGDVVHGRSDIVYARMTLGGRDLPYYRFTDAGGETNYYDETGHSAKKSLMKTPIDGARLSSGYGMRRHPVLGYSKMHRGIDFAAPRGTPIYAAGDGVIQRMGPFSSYGNYVRIRHQNGIETAYAHLNGFKSGLRSGSRVKQGQVIGYVGTTGRSTGPHLHYEILMNGKHVNPGSVRLPTGKALKGKDLESFKTTMAALDGKIKKIGEAPALAQVNR